MKSNKVTNYLRRKKILLKEMEIEVFGFKDLKNLCLEDHDFVEAWKEYTKSVTLDKDQVVVFHHPG